MSPQIAPYSGLCCPGCGGPTEMLTLRYGAGASMVTEQAPAWCWPCLDARVHAARVGNADVCHCSQTAGPHVHQAREVAA